MGSFVRFLGQLIEENGGNTKVMIHLLEVHDVLLESFLSAQTAHKQQHNLIKNLFEIGFDSKAQVYLLFEEKMKILRTWASEIRFRNKCQLFFTDQD
jgi:hypothetical protein